MVLALHQAARIVPGHHVTKTNVAWQDAEQRNPIPNQHRHARDNETLDESRRQKPLDHDTTIDIEVVGAAGSELRNDVNGRPCQVVDEMCVEPKQLAIAFR